MRATLSQSNTILKFPSPSTVHAYIVFYSHSQLRNPWITIHFQFIIKMNREHVR